MTHVALNESEISLQSHLCCLTQNALIHNGNIGGNYAKLLAVNNKTKNEKSNR